MKSTTVEKPAEVIEKRILELQEEIDALQQQLGEKTNARRLLSRRVDDCQVEIDRCKELLSGLDKDLGKIAVELADGTIEREDAPCPGESY
jgi:chromosome segregation ATPase